MDMLGKAKAFNDALISGLRKSRKERQNKRRGLIFNVVFNLFVLVIVLNITLFFRLK